MSRTIFLTGGSGFVGSAVIEELLSRDFSIRALVNQRELRTSDPRLRSVRGGLFDVKALDEGMAGCDAVIHLVGIIMENRSKDITFERMHVEATRQVVDAAKRAGIRRYVHMSALGTRADAVSDYHKTKWRAEEYVRASGLDWTILRPSLIHGARGEFMQMEAKWARKQAPPFLFMPYFGAGFFGAGGAGLLQPVFVKDVARAFVDAIDNPQTIGKIYALAGPDRMTWPQMHQIVSQAIVGKKRWVMALPVWKAKLLASVMPAKLLPFNRDQVIMSQEDNTADTSEFRRDFGWDPQPFAATLAGYAKQI